MGKLISECPPLITSRYGIAWDSHLPPGDLRSGLNVWVVYAPWAHPHWHSYAFSLAHLRRMEGCDEPTLFSPRATHEIVVVALDPAQAIMEGGPLHWLSPVNYNEQFEAASDGCAIEHVVHCLHEVCDGALSPDSSCWASWHDRFPFANPKRLETLEPMGHA